MGQSLHSAAASFNVPFKPKDNSDASHVRLRFAFHCLPSWLSAMRIDVSAVDACDEC